MVSPSSFVIKLNSHFDINQSVLYKLYVPVVGINAVFLYEYLYNEYHLKHLTNISVSDYDDLCSLLKWTNQQLHEAFKRLEAIGLIKKYINNDFSNQITYLMFPSLEFDDFIANQEFVKLLEKNTSPTERYSLNYIFSKALTNYELIEQSTPIDYLFELQGISLEYEQNLDFIYQFFLNKYSTPVVIELVLKQKLISLLLNKQIEAKNLLKILENSLTKANNCFELKEKIFNIKFHEYIMQIDKNTSYKTIKINRNFEIFSFKANLDHFQTVIAEYNNWTSEEYFKLAAKQTLSLEITKSFKMMREKYALADSFINVLIDFCLFKNNGRFSIKYIEKIASTVSKSGLNKLESIIIYLGYVANNKTNLFISDIIKQQSHDAQKESSPKEQLNFDFSFLDESSSKNT